MARFCSLFSSSSGNCSYVDQPDGGILIDVGVTAKRTAETLDCIGVDIGSVGAIFVTHEHSDHIKGVGIMSRKYGPHTGHKGARLKAQDSRLCQRRHA